MIEIERALLLPIAFVLFLLGAETAADLSWRGAPVSVTVTGRQ
jgi:hypothetical protein